MDYFKEVSPRSLRGKEGYWRLPQYVGQEFVFDEQRHELHKEAVRRVRGGGNILLTGRAGTGKTALMYMILEKIAENQCVGVIQSAEAIGTTHERQGIVLFCDDLPRLPSHQLTSISRNNVKRLVATARVEELGQLPSETEACFTRLGPLKPFSGEKISQMVFKYAERENVAIKDEAAVEKVVERANGFPVYVWQVIRSRRIDGEPLTMDFARQAPKGMLNYIDEILWNLLQNKSDPERYAVLVTLLCMTDLPRYAMHQDLFETLFKLLKQRFGGETTPFPSRTLRDIARYLSIERDSYAYRLPHDCWADVLQGKSGGPLKPEISSVSRQYSRRKRETLLREAYALSLEDLTEIDDTRRRSALQSFDDALAYAHERSITEKPRGPTVSDIQATLRKLKKADTATLAEELECDAQTVERLVPAVDTISSKTGDYLYDPTFWEQTKEKARSLLNTHHQIPFPKLAKELGLPIADARKISEELAKTSEKIQLQDNEITSTRSKKKVELTLPLSHPPSLEDTERERISSLFRSPLTQMAVAFLAAGVFLFIDPSPILPILYDRFGILPIISSLIRLAPLGYYCSLLVVGVALFREDTFSKKARMSGIFPIISFFTYLPYPFPYFLQYTREVLGLYFLGLPIFIHLVNIADLSSACFFIMIGFELRKMFDLQKAPLTLIFLSILSIFDLVLWYITWTTNIFEISIYHLLSYVLPENLARFFYSMVFSYPNGVLLCFIGWRVWEKVKSGGDFF